MERKEFLMGSSAQMVIGFAESPMGAPCIGMRLKNRDWILLTSKRAPLAASLMKQLKEQFNVDSVPATPFDWRESLSTRELRFHEEEGALGVYVQADRFDELISSMAGT